MRHLAAPKGEDVTIPSPVRHDAWLSVTLIPYGQNQRLAIVRDVTRQVKLETMRRDFVANASHELRSPLTVISGYLDSLAEDDELPKSLEGPVGEMQRQAERMTQILVDLIELTRLESAEAAARQEFVDIGEMLQEIVDEFSKRSPGRRIELHLESDVALLGKEVEFHSIAYNLIENAVQFTSPSGRIDVTWRSTGRGAGAEIVESVGTSVDVGQSLEEGADTGLSDAGASWTPSLPVEAADASGGAAAGARLEASVEGGASTDATESRVDASGGGSRGTVSDVSEESDGARNTSERNTSEERGGAPNTSEDSSDARNTLEASGGALSASADNGVAENASGAANARERVDARSSSASAASAHTRADTGWSGGAELIVADTGIGIPSDQISRVTERFYRIERGRSRSTGGTGLGLAIVKHALERHGGTLEICSEEGRGSTFICRFPASRVVRRADDTARNSERAVG